MDLIYFSKIGGNSKLLTGSWSDLNTVAISSLERPNELYIYNPNFPDEFATINTQHRSAIRFMEWSPMGMYLITADESNLLCLWKTEV